MSCHNNHVIQFEFYMMGHFWMFMQDGCVATVGQKRVGTWRWDPVTSRVIWQISNIRIDASDGPTFDKFAQQSHEAWLANQVLA